MGQHRQRTYRVVKQTLVVTATTLITTGLIGLCIASWAVVGEAPDPTFDLLLGAVAATGALAVAAWAALVILVVALTALPGRLGATASRVAGSIAPAGARRRAQVALGIAATTAQIGLVMAPATAADAPAGATPPRTSSVSSTSGVGDLPPIGRPPVRPPVVIPDPDVESPLRPSEPSGPSGPGATPEPEPRPSDDAPMPSQHHERVIVEPGDTLWDIAADHLDDPTPAAVARAWPLWFTANRDAIGPDPDHIRPGTVLTPPAPTTDAATGADR